MQGNINSRAGPDCSGFLRVCSQTLLLALDTKGTLAVAKILVTSKLVKSV